MRGPNFQSHLALIEFDHGGAPHVSLAPPFMTEFQGTAGRDTAGEYLALTFLKNGELSVVAPMREPGKLGEGFSLWRAASQRAP